MKDAITLNWDMELEIAKYSWNDPGFIPAKVRIGADAWIDSPKLDKATREQLGDVAQLFTESLAHLKDATNYAVNALACYSQWGNESEAEAVVGSFATDLDKEGELDRIKNALLRIGALRKDMREVEKIVTRCSDRMVEMGTDNSSRTADHKYRIIVERLAELEPLIKEVSKELSVIKGQRLHKRLSKDALAVSATRRPMRLINLVNFLYAVFQWKHPGARGHKAAICRILETFPEKSPEFRVKLPHVNDIIQRHEGGASSLSQFMLGRQRSVKFGSRSLIRHNDGNLYWVDEDKDQLKRPIFIFEDSMTEDTGTMDVPTQDDWPIIIKSVSGDIREIYPGEALRVHDKSYRDMAIMLKKARERFGRVYVDDQDFKVRDIVPRSTLDLPGEGSV